MQAGFYPFIFNEELFEITEIQSRSTIVLYEELSQKTLKDSDHLWLLKIMNAANQQEKDLILINTALPESKDWTQINTINCSFIIGFGANANAFPGNLKMYHPMQFGTKKAVAFPALSNIESIKDMKKNVWAALRALYNLM